MSVELEEPPYLLGKETWNLYPLIRRAAELCPSIVVIEGFLWAADQPAIHHGALCEEGKELLLRADAERAWEPRLVWVGILRRYEKGGVRRSTICPECQRRAGEVLRSSQEAPRAHVKCLDERIMVVYTGSASETERAFETLESQGLAEWDDGGELALRRPSTGCGTARAPHLTVCANRHGDAALS
jgi:hypothetical protein